jgi:hypothetical protein
VVTVKYNEIIESKDGTPSLFLSRFHSLREGKNEGSWEDIVRAFKAVTGRE